MTTDKVILGIDPGTTIMGYGIIQITQNKPVLITMGVIELKKYSDHYVKLRHIFKRTLSLIDEYHPDEVAIESQFYGKNIQSMIKLGRAQGVAISAALYRSIPIFEYAPRKIKLSITGRGNASKEQVAGILQNILKIKDLPVKLDATDGLAAAICHHFQKKSSHQTASSGQMTKYKSWKDYVNR